MQITRLTTSETSPSNFRRGKNNTMKNAATLVYSFALAAMLHSTACGAFVLKRQSHLTAGASSTLLATDRPSTSSTALNVISIWASRTSLRRSDSLLTSGSAAAAEERARLSKESWSKALSAEEDNNRRRESRFGVRRRIKAVLQKARNRTGLNNENSGYNNNRDDLGSADEEVFEMFDDEELVEETTTSPKSLQIPDFTSSTILKEPSSFPDVKEEISDTVFDELFPDERPEKLNIETTIAPTSTKSVPSEAETNVNGGSATVVNGGSPIVNGSQKALDAYDKTVAQPGAPVAAKQQQQKVDPLPFKLPKLSEEQLQKLRQGERIQEQSKMGREGSGYVVWDIEAPPFVVWECLLDFEAYPQNIGTVRSMTIFTNTHLQSSYIAEKPVLPGTGRETRHYGMGSITRARFVLSKFKLNIAAVHKYQPHPDGHFMEFTLDKACTNIVLQDARGIWYTEENPEGRQGYTRVWLLCEVRVSSLLPSFIVDYTANRAMPRATTWLKPVVAKVKEELLGVAPNGQTKESS